MIIIYVIILLIIGEKTNNMSYKKILFLFLLIIVIALGVNYFKNVVGDIPEAGVCSAEAKVCSDGSAVGRVGPDCGFEKCPD